MVKSRWKPFWGDERRGNCRGFDLTMRFGDFLPSLRETFCLINKSMEGTCWVASCSLQWNFELRTAKISSFPRAGREIYIHQHYSTKTSTHSHSSEPQLKSFINLWHRPQSVLLFPSENTFPPHCSTFILPVAGQTELKSRWWSEMTARKKVPQRRILLMIVSAWRRRIFASSFVWINYMKLFFLACQVPASLGDSCDDPKLMICCELPFSPQSEWNMIEEFYVWVEKSRF